MEKLWGKVLLEIIGRTVLVGNLGVKNCADNFWWIFFVGVVILYKKKNYIADFCNCKCRRGGGFARFNFYQV